MQTTTEQSLESWLLTSSPRWILVHHTIYSLSVYTSFANQHTSDLIDVQEMLDDGWTVPYYLTLSLCPWTHFPKFRSRSRTYMKLYNILSSLYHLNPILFMGSGIPFYTKMSLSFPSAPQSPLVMVPQTLCLTLPQYVKHLVIIHNVLVSLFHQAFYMH